VRLKARGRTDRVLNLTCWDVGGCGRGIFSSFIAQYASHVDAIIWFVGLINALHSEIQTKNFRLVDSNDRQRLEDSITEFSTITGLVAADTTIPPKERPVLM
jgi:2-polyprenyl-3-methyl-5-hydroxy-6-metoxy-1,4-benzoquinol methylase